MLNSSNNLTSVFHLAIIASLVLSLNGCGYKAAPFYKQAQETTLEDDNVKFIVKNSSEDNNATQK